MRHEPAGVGDDDRLADEEGGAGTDHAPRLGNVACADGLADQDGRGHAETEHRADQEEHDVVGVRGGGQRRLAEEAPHPHRIHRTIQRLRDVAGQDRQGKQQEIAADRAGGQVKRRFGHGVVIDSREAHTSTKPVCGMWQCINDYGWDGAWRWP
ncbi:hypothetical protein G6F32_015038 [Rhizopus arrhizus]|nr:hypothetical protein G6F32_015038 [Rhizopus arrhizus]